MGDRGGRRRERQSRRGARGALGAGLTVLVGVAVWSAWPGWRDPVFDENRIVEDLTVVFYLLAFVTGLVAAIRLRGRYKTLSLAAIPVIALLFAGEELDWGFLVFWHEPRWLGGFGFNLHDVPDEVGEAAGHGSLPLPDWVAVIALVALALVGARAAIRWYRQDSLCSEPAMALLAVTLALVGLAKIADVHPLKKAVLLLLGFNLRPVEESAELAGSVILFLAAWRLRRIVVRDARFPTPAPAASVSGLLNPSPDVAPEVARLTSTVPTGSERR
jgi:hypothetical protein